MNRFRGKVAIVTGAGAGIGRATALRLASEGAQVAAFDISRERAEETVKTIEENGGRAAPFVADVSEKVSVEASVDAVVTQLGLPFCLVNCAGILKISPALTMTVEEFDAVIGVNLRGVFLMSTAVARHMVAAAQPGRIVNVSSIHAAISLRDSAGYAASKGGIEALTFTLAADWAEYGITVNAVRPGATWSALTTPMYTPEVLSALEKRIPLGAVAQPEQVAAAIAYLASEEASYSTGAVLAVDGGYTVNGDLPGKEYSPR
ncbi:SDR family NAD(P)-dependent oxidoreductase [Arthrobacter sp. 4R501]|uniref:SDR family NAD(P)-dependent oxidoreductase n=1 Tax=Arthrobacter sp. 4R501 TaxID=2058886 RepID=UPI000CE487D4|nr:SDR family oxidoreductase [Arthrobacter sp. 4R501]